VANPPQKEFFLKDDISLRSESCGAWITLDLMCIYRKTHNAEEKQWFCRPDRAADMGG